MPDRLCRGIQILIIRRGHFKDFHDLGTNYFETPVAELASIPPCLTVRTIAIFAYIGGRHPPCLRRGPWGDLQDIDLRTASKSVIATVFGRINAEKRQ